MLSNKKITSYAAPLDLLANRVILVTGAGDGIGRAVARACAAHGATVLLAGRTIAKLEDTYDAIAAAGGCDAIICPIDIEGATSDDFQQFNADIESQFGRLDGLVNNAGILGQRTPLNHYKTNVWERVKNQCKRTIRAHSGLDAIPTGIFDRRFNHIYIIRGGAQRSGVLGRLCGVKICRGGSSADVGSRSRRHGSVTH